MRIEDLKKDIESCYDIEFIDHNSDNLVITFTPAFYISMTYQQRNYAFQVRYLIIICIILVP